MATALPPSPNGEIDHGQVRQTINELIADKDIRAAFGNTVKGGAVKTIALTAVALPIIPPDPATWVNADATYSGWRIVKLNAIAVKNGLTVTADGGLLVGAGGDYKTDHAWLNMSASVNNATAGFCFAIVRAGTVSFTSRISGGAMPTLNRMENVSGGGWLDGALTGDVIYLAVASDTSCTLSIHDCNIALSKR